MIVIISVKIILSASNLSASVPVSRDTWSATGFASTLEKIARTAEDVGTLVSEISTVSMESVSVPALINSALMSIGVSIRGMTLIIAAPVEINVLLERFATEETAFVNRGRRFATTSVLMYAEILITAELVEISVLLDLVATEESVLVRRG